MRLMYNQKQVSSYVSLAMSVMSKVLGRSQTQRIIDEQRPELDGDDEGMVTKTTLENFAESLLTKVGNSGKQAALRDELEEELDEL